MRVMDKDSMHKKGLLEQYLLGLTSLEETQEVEEYLASDPEARKELEHLRGQLGMYLDDRGIEGKEGTDKTAGPDDQEEAMLAYLLNRNQRLNALRTILAVCCVLLLGSTIYFFRQSRIHQGELLSEKARHVQDDNLHARELKQMERAAIHLDSLHTTVNASPSGNLLLHHLATDSVILLDLSHLEPPAEGFAYHIHLASGDTEVTRHVVSAEQLNALYPLERSAERLRVLHGPKTPSTDPIAPNPQLVTELELTLAIAVRD